MNPEFADATPLPTILETHQLLDSMKKCSFEQIGPPDPGGSVRRRASSTGSQTEKRKRFESLDEQEEALPEGQKSLKLTNYEDLQSLKQWFDNSKDDQLAKIFGSSIIMSDDVFIKQLFDGFYPQHLRDDNYLGLLRQYKIALTYHLHTVFYLPTFEELAEYLSLDLDDSEMRALDIEGMFTDITKTIANQLGLAHWAAWFDGYAKAESKTAKSAYDVFMGNWFSNVCLNVVAGSAIRFGETGLGLGLAGGILGDWTPVFAVTYGVIKILTIISKQWDNVKGLSGKMLDGTATVGGVAIGIADLAVDMFTMISTGSSLVWYKNQVARGQEVAQAVRALSAAEQVVETSLEEFNQEEVQSILDSVTWGYEQFSTPDQSSGGMAWRVWLAATNKDGVVRQGSGLAKNIRIVSKVKELLFNIGSKDSMLKNFDKLTEEGFATLVGRLTATIARKGLSGGVTPISIITDRLIAAAQYSMGAALTSLVVYTGTLNVGLAETLYKRYTRRGNRFERIFFDFWWCGLTLLPIVAFPLVFYKVACWDAQQVTRAGAFVFKPDSVCTFGPTEYEQIVNGLIDKGFKGNLGVQPIHAILNLALYAKEYMLKPSEFVFDPQRAAVIAGYGWVLVDNYKKIGGFFTTAGAGTYSLWKLRGTVEGFRPPEGGGGGGGGGGGDPLDVLKQDFRAKFQAIKNLPGRMRQNALRALARNNRALGLNGNSSQQTIMDAIDNAIENLQLGQVIQGL